MVEFDSILWKGKIPITNVEIHFDDEYKLELPKKVEKQVKKIWTKHKKQYSTLYDGKLLGLNSFKANEEEIKFKVFELPFSQLVAMTKLQLFPEDYNGHIGFKTLIWKGNLLLVGKRSENMDYLAGYRTVPGGMIEKEDVPNPFFKAVEREIHEETKLKKLDCKLMNLILIGRQHGNRGVNLILQGPYLKDETIQSNKEWEKGTLGFKSTEEICQFDEDQCLGELNYLREKLC